MRVETREIGSVMQGVVTFLESTDRLDLANTIMKLKGIRHIPVVDDGNLVGVVSQKDLLFAALSSVLEADASDELRLRTVMIEEVMAREPVVARIDTSLSEAAHMMLGQQVGCLPVVDDSARLIGIVSESDLLRAAFLEVSP